MAEQPAASARLTVRVPTMINSLTERIETWFERSPKAQRAVKRLSADLDALVVRV